MTPADAMARVEEELSVYRIAACVPTNVLAGGAGIDEARKTLLTAISAYGDACAGREEVVVCEGQYVHDAGGGDVLDPDNRHSSLVIFDLFPTTELSDALKPINGQRVEVIVRVRAASKRRTEDGG